MRILYLSEDAPLDADAAATGNQIRSDALARQLEIGGIEVARRWSEEFTPDTIAELVGKVRPDVMLLGYWKLLEALPEDRSCPVVADCIAPRPLEEHFVDPALSESLIARYARALDRADLVLVGNARQRWLLAGWMMTAGADFREQVPIAVVPLAISPRSRARNDHGRPLVLAAGGREWPWRKSRRWLEELIAPEMSGNAELHCFGSSQPTGPGIEHRELLAWGQWHEYLETTVHVGVELADANIERELSQSFRATSFLQAGLPLILNENLPLADRVRDHDAGWIVASPEQARAAVSEAVEQPDAWRRKAEGAWRLGREELDPDHCIKPLINWLEHPRMRPRAALAAPARRTRTMDRRPSLIGMILRLLLTPFRREIRGEGVVVITRSDLFPTDHGAAVKIVETARGLARQGRPVAIVTADRGHYYQVETDGISRRSLPWWLRAIALPRTVSHLLHRLRGLPASNAFLYWPLYDPAYGLRAAWVGRRIGAATCLAEFPGYAHSARICRLFNGGRAVLAEHNVEYQRLAEQIEDLKPGQYERFKRIELGLANCMDGVVCVSDRDRRQLIADGLDPASLVTIPHGVDLDAFDAAEPVDLAAGFDFDPNRPVLAYHGTFSYPPNRQALLVILDELLPRLRKLGHRAQVLAIGSGAPRALDHPDIRLPGSLPELAGPLKACDLAIVPLVSGGGTRMKILDYFAAALPVVSTSKGCEGLPVSDGRELLIRDNWDRFAEAVAGLLDDAERSKQFGRAGHELAAGLSWTAIGKRYDMLFKRLRE